MKNLLLFTIFLALISCATVKQLHESPSVDSIELHQNPKVGDYAIIEDVSKRFKQTYRIDAIRGNKYDVSFIFDFSFLLFSKKVHYLMTVDRQGKVLRGAIKYKDNNVKEQIVAKKNGEMSRSKYESIKLPKEMIVKTAAGSFNIDEVTSYNLIIDQNVSTTQNSYVSELSNTVPFRTVRMYQTSTTNEGLLLNILHYFKKKYTAALVPHDLLKKVIRENKGADNTIELEYRLIEYGNKKARP